MFVWILLISPIATPNELILAGITDIVNVLNDKSPGTVLTVLNDSNVDALRQLTEVITGVPALTSTNSETTKNDASLRVETTNKNNENTAPSLRVDTAVTIAPAVPRANNEDETATYDKTTGPIGKRRRKQKKKVTLPQPEKPKVQFEQGTKRGKPCKKSAADKKSDSKTKYPRPTQSTQTKPAPPKPAAPTVVPTTPIPIAKPAAPINKHVPKHKHGTRANKSFKHNAAAALIATTADSPFNLFPPSPIDDRNGIFQHFAFHGNAFNPDTGEIAEYAELSKCSDGEKWRAGCADEFGRLLNGHGDKMPKGTETMFFIHPSKIPKNKKPTYMRIVAAYRPEKKEPYRVRFTCGGDRIDYVGDVSTKTADITTVKLLINDTLSTPNAKLMCADLSNFYLETPMDEFEYMRIPLHVVPDSIMDEYNLHDLVVNGFLYVEIRKGMYGLPQSGKLANDRLTKLLKPHGYAPVPITPGLWKHETRPITFTLVVDDFAVKCTDRADAEHLMNALKENYSVSEDWEGKKYCGIQLDWDYVNRTCDLSMPGYILRALQRFQHEMPPQLQHSPHEWQKPNYGAKTQYAQREDNTPLLNADDTKRVQEVLGTLLYYARAVDPTMLVAIGTIATQQTKGTMATMQAIEQLLNYCATHPDAIIRYHASDMCLHIDSDASYLSVSKSRSRSAGFHYLSSRPVASTDATPPTPPLNGAILTPCQILKEIVSSAAEAEVAGTFHNGKEACPIRITLDELGYPQEATIIITDNSTAVGIANDTVKQKRSKAIDMRYYWIRDRVRQGQFRILWKKGSLNKADYFTKHHPAAHHRQIRSSYLHIPNDNTKNYFEVLQDIENESASKG